jgi:hypothetical protein
MASVLNTILNLAASNTYLPLFRNNWEEVDQWNFAVITINAPKGTLLLQWANTDRGQFPNIIEFPRDGSDTIAQEVITIEQGVKTITRDHRGRWFKLMYKADVTGGIVNISTNYKVFNSHIKIVDEKALTSIGGTTNASFLTAATDSTGLKLKDTGAISGTGSSLYTTLRDSNGETMATTNVGGADPASLITAICDSSGLAISHVVGQGGNHSMVSSMTNHYGVAQATTREITGASTAGVASFLALGDASGATVSSLKTSSRTDFTGNSMYVAMCSSDGSLNSALNPFWIDVSSDPIEGVRAFDFSTGGITRDLVTPNQQMTSKVNMFNYYIYNDGATTAWVKLYDITTASAELLNYTAVASANIVETPLGQQGILFLNNPPGSYTAIVEAEGQILASQFSLTISINPEKGTELGNFQYVPDATAIEGGYWIPKGGATRPTGNFIFSVSGGRSTGNLLLYSIADERPNKNPPSGNNPFPQNAFIIRTVYNSQIYPILDNAIGASGEYIAHTTPSKRIGRFGVVLDAYALNVPPLITKGGYGYTDGPATASLGPLGNLNINIVARTDFSALNPYIVQNIACGAKSLREITYPRGLEFKNGVYMRSTLEPSYTTINGPPSNNIFVNGLYVNYK